MTGADVAAAAARLEGAPFRLHGRDPATGLDCVGVVVAAFAACGVRLAGPVGYGLHNSGITRWLGLAEEAGFVEASGDPRPGDIILVRPGPGQHHLLITLPAGRFLHAHAGLRRVVVQPGPLGWPVVKRWRLAN
ncbi:NlpC/P60 family protein [Tsuneonella dongtanensis]|uniref:NlpC/P60 family protein n=1 Tax=Tsuneonella dongtanensis TaxID=692370 RepID=A0A1B2A9H5_9SPHN|nr:NlpC/P60 family protein [Tsuneonella dongtanensis]ANY18809.1 NlpC/P60 family protein [Tsuneonella dongtanensis]